MPMNLAEAPPSPPFQQKAGRGGVRFASLSLVELVGNTGDEISKDSRMPGGALEKHHGETAVTDRSLNGVDALRNCFLEQLCSLPLTPMQLRF